MSICRSFFVTKCLKPTVSDCDLSPQLPALYPGLASPFGKFLQLGLCQAGGVWQPLCQRLAEPAQSCRLRLRITVAVIWGAFPCPLCWAESGLSIPDACARSFCPSPDHAVVQGGSMSPSLLKWQLHLAVSGGLRWQGFVAGKQMFDPFPGACWSHRVLS